MKKVLLSSMGSVVCAAIVALLGAQPAAQAGQPNKVTVIGCIKASGAGANAEMTVRDYRGGPAPSFKLSGDAEQLKLNVNQTVELVGTITGAAAGTPTLKVEKMLRIATTCWPSQDGK